MFRIPYVMSNINVAAASVVVVAITLGLSSAVAAQKQDDVKVVTVVGCLRHDSGDLPWVLKMATEGKTATIAFSSQDELKASGEQPLGSLEYRLLGVSEFGVEPHVGHKVQVKGLQFRYEGESRINVTSFQHLAPNCE